MANQPELPVQLNNRGVAYLEKGNLNKAFTFFRYALRNTMTLLESNLEAPKRSMVQGTRRAWKNKGLQAFVTSKPLTRRVASPCEFMYSQGITLLEEPDAYSLDDAVNMTVTSSIVLFNLALLHHIKGLQESTSRYLVKAEAFYSRSYQLLVGTGLELGGSGNPVIDLVSMALLNNAAHVGRELCHSERSQENFRKLMKLAVQVNTTTYGDSAISTFMEEAKNGFLLNAIVLSDQSRAPAA